MQCLAVYGMSVSETSGLHVQELRACLLVFECRVGTTAQQKDCDVGWTFMHITMRFKRFLVAVSTSMKRGAALHEPQDVMKMARHMLNASFIVSPAHQVFNAARKI